MEADVAKVKYTLLLPLHYNDGRPVPRKIRTQIYDEIYRLADGYGLAGEVKGAYRMKDGSKQVDRSQIIWIGIREEQESELKHLAAKIARDLRQESLYLERTAGTIEFIPPLPPEVK